MTGHQGTHAAARRHRQSEFLRNAVRVMWALIAAVVLLLAGFTFHPEWTRLSDMKHDLVAQKTKLEELRKETQARELEVHLLQNDPRYLEMIARDRLDLMKEGETIFRLSSTNGHKS
jgi:cell division protein FtsB